MSCWCSAELEGKGSGPPHLARISAPPIHGGRSCSTAKEAMTVQQDVGLHWPVVSRKNGPLPPILQPPALLPTSPPAGASEIQRYLTRASSSGGGAVPPSPRAPGSPRAGTPRTGEGAPCWQHRRTLAPPNSNVRRAACAACGIGDAGHGCAFVSCACRSCRQSQRSAALYSRQPAAASCSVMKLGRGVPAQAPSFCL